MNSPMVKGNSVDDVMNKNVNGESPRFSYHFRVRATLKKLPML